MAAALIRAVRRPCVMSRLAGVRSPDMTISALIAHGHGTPDPGRCKAVVRAVRDPARSLSYDSTYIWPSYSAGEQSGRAGYSE